MLARLTWLKGLPGPSLLVLEVHAAAEIRPDRGQLLLLGTTGAGPAILEANEIRRLGRYLLFMWNCCGEGGSAGRATRQATGTDPRR